MDQRVNAGHHRGPAGGADGADDVGVAEQDTVAGEPGGARALDEPVAVGRGGRRLLLVGNQVEDVGAIAGTYGRPPGGSC